MKTSVFSRCGKYVLTPAYISLRNERNKLKVENHKLKEEVDDLKDKLLESIYGQEDCKLQRQNQEQVNSK